MNGAWEPPVAVLNNADSGLRWVGVRPCSLYPQRWEKSGRRPLLPTFIVYRIALIAFEGMPSRVVAGRFPGRQNRFTT